MGKFEIRDTFYLNGEPYQIISGAIHYFRTVPEYWQDRLEKLKAMGCNTVETYIPWNMHEPRKGQFVFEGEQVAIDMENDVQYVSMCPQCYFREKNAFYRRRSGIPKPGASGRAR